MRIASLLILASLSAAASAQQLWVGSYFQNAVTRLDLSNGANLGTLPGGVANPLGMERRNGKVYVTAESANQVRMYDEVTGAFLGNFAEGNMNGPTEIAFNAAGQAFVANFNDNSVSRFAADGTYLGRFLSPGIGGLNGPDLGMAFGPDGNLYVPNYWNNKIARFDGATGAYLGDFVLGGTGGPSQPRQLLWRGGKLYVASDNGNKVLRYDATSGAYLDTFVAAGSGGLRGAVGMAFFGDHLYVASSRTGQVLRFRADTGAFVDVFASGLGSPVSLQVVPEPVTLVGFGAGLAMLVRRVRRAPR